MSESDLETNNEEITGKHGTIRAYYANKKGSESKNAIILIHEIFGLTEHIMSVANRFAEQGYCVIAPDLYSYGDVPSRESISRTLRFVSSVPPDKQRDPEAMAAAMEAISEEERQDISGTWDWLRNRDYTKNVDDLTSVYGWLRDKLNAKNISCVGFCMGGTLAGRLAATGAKLSATIIFYGEAPPDDSIKNINSSVLGIYGGEDHRITDNVPTLAKQMEAADKPFEYHVYPNAYHAFFNDTGKNYNEEAAKDAWLRTNAFLSKCMA